MVFFFKSDPFYRVPDVWVLMQTGNPHPLSCRERATGGASPSGDFVRLS